MLKRINIFIRKGISKELVFALVLAVVIAFSSFLGYSSPLSAALCAYMPINLSVAFLIVFFVAEIAVGINAFSLAAMFSALLVLLIRIVKQKFDVKKNVFTQYLYPFVIYLFLSIAFLIVFQSGPAAYLVAVIFSALNLLLLIALKYPHTKQMSAFLFFVLTASLSGIDLIYINIGRAFGIYAVLAIGAVCGTAISCFGGILCACAVALYNPAMFQSTVFVCIIGIICSGRGIRHKLRIPLYAVATSIVCAVLSGAGEYEIGFAVDTLIAVVAFILTEQKAVLYVNKFIPRSSDSSLMSGILSSQTQSYHHSLALLNSYLESKLSSSFLRRNDPIEAMYAGVCMTCENHDLCFGGKASSIKSAFNSCHKRDSLMSFAENLKKSSDYNLKSSLKHQARICEAIDVVKTICEVVDDITLKVKSTENVNAELTNKLVASLKENGAECVCACVYNDLTLYIDFSGHKRISEVRLCLLVSELMSVDYPMPEVIVLERTVRYSFYPNPAFCCDCGFAQVSAQTDSCGDSFDSFTFGKKFYCIVCDGMGTGRQAQVSSQHLMSLVRHQLMSGTSEKAAVSLASLIMRLTAFDENFSTLDLLCADLETGKLEFYKAGACQSVVIGKGMTVVSGGGYPFGILSDNEIRTHETKITDDSIVVMLTDGVKDVSNSKIEAAVSELKSFSSDEIAENIIKYSVSDAVNIRTDDITVAVIKLERRKR